ncbi:hypothetical protein NRB20_14760 [Nocardia sp. RB20]|uniref:Uncharacterized protein n=1 Tax=Nocardia macrotermitis TaxID=2585198 RepID=A0A7K0CY21_9NOCA|nr:hypothetical protein [Nocardia macrotermitis]
MGHLHHRRRQPKVYVPQLNIELVVVRGPDGPVAITVFVDGVEYPTTEYTVDAGAGWTWEDGGDRTNSVDCMSGFPAHDHMS